MLSWKVLPLLLWTWGRWPDFCCGSHLSTNSISPLEHLLVSAELGPNSTPRERMDYFCHSLCSLIVKFFSENRCPRPPVNQLWWFFIFTRSREITSFSVVLFLGQEKKYNHVIHTLFTCLCYQKTNSHLFIKQRCLGVLIETGFDIKYTTPTIQDLFTHCGCISLIIINRNVAKSSASLDASVWVSFPVSLR